MEHALKVLEFENIQARLADHCESMLGRAFASELLPSFDPKVVETIRAETSEAIELANGDLLPPLGGIHDVRQACIKASKGGTLDGLTLYQIGFAMSVMRQWVQLLRSKSFQHPHLHELSTTFFDDPKTVTAIFDSLDSGGEVLDSASPELGRLRKNIRNSTHRLTEKINKYTTGAARDYLSDPIVTQRNGRYVVPVKSEHRAKVKGIVHDSSSSGQTVYIEPMDVHEIGNALRQAEAQEAAEVARILRNLSERIGANGGQIAVGIESAGKLDLILAKARYGFSFNGDLAASAPPGFIKIERGRHPLLDERIAVPLSLQIGGDVTTLLITGPNTGGKTVTLKTVGLFVTMNQCGIPVPASRTKIGMFSQIWADIGDEQSLQQSLSTFSGHIRNIAEAIRSLTPNALVLLDEVGAGTDPQEGAALARAVLIELQRGKAITVASTHYGELKLFAANTEGFLNCSMEFDQKSLKPTYVFLEGTPGSSHALKIAERNGLPKRVIELAQADQGVEEKDIAAMLEQLELAQKRAQKAQSEADRLAHKLREEEKRAAKALEEAERIRKTTKQAIVAEVEEEMRRIRVESAELFEQIKKAGATSTNDIREKLKTLQRRGAEVADRVRPEESQAAAGTARIAKGQTVMVRNLNQKGLILDDPKDGRATVQVGPAKMKIALEDLITVEVPVPTKVIQKASKGVILQKAQTAHTELDMRGVRAEEAEHLLENFLDESLLAGLENVRIVHGKGEGILREMTRNCVRRHKGVQNYRDGDSNEGGHGVTIVTFK